MLLKVQLSPSFFSVNCIENGGGSKTDKRLNNWMIKIVKVNKLYLDSLLVSIVNRVSRSGTMKYPCGNADVSNKKWLLT